MSKLIFLTVTMNQKSIIVASVVVAIVFVGAIVYFVMTNEGGQSVFSETVKQSKSITIDTSDWQLFNAGKKGDSTFILPNFKFPINWQTINISGGQRAEIIFSDSNQKNIADETDNECRFSVLYDGNDNSKKISKRNSKNTAVLKNECGLILEELEKQVTIENNITVSWQTYINQTGEFVLKYPSDWVSGICGQNCVMFGPINKQDYTPVLVATSLAPLDIAKKERFESENKFLSEEKINLGNDQWTKLSFLYSENGDEIHEYLIEHGGKTYIFEDISEIENISVPMFSSFKFTK